jgi:hypothetical protein
VSKKMLQANLRIAFASLAGVVLVGGLGVFHASADSWDKKTVLTINEPVQVRERLLQPGTYVFKLLNSGSDRHTVQIFNADQSQIIDTVLAIPNYRLQPTGNSRFGFWETPPGYAKALRSWFYPGELAGDEFPYPKKLAEIDESAGVTITRVPMAQPPQQEVARVEQPRPVETAPAPQPAPPQEVARVEAPPTAPEPTPEPAPAPPPQASPTPAPEPQAPATLPKTATSYPAIGLAGLCCLVVFGLVRDKGVKRLG